MQGRTHLAAGTALALALLKPDTPAALVSGAAAAAIGSIISDIDEGKSGSRNDAVRAGAVLLAVAAVSLMADRIWNLGILQKLLSRVGSEHRIFALLFFILLCCIGVLSKHRSFMHSFLGMLLLASCVYVLYPELAPYFLAGFASHLALDFLNRRGEMLLFPMRKRYSLKIAGSDGLLNKVLLIAGFAFLIIVIYTSQPFRELLARTGEII